MHIKHSQHYLNIGSFGLPEEIRSDNGSEYINTELIHFCNYFEIKFKSSTTYAPWTNG